MIFDVRIGALHQDAARASAEGLDLCVVADRDIAEAGKNAVGAIACCYEIAQIEKVGVGFNYGQCVLVEAGSGNALGVYNDWHLSSLSVTVSRGWRRTHFLPA